MSTRSRDAGRLAQLLTEHTGIPVTVTYHGNAKDYLGGWHVGWTDGPTVACALVSWLETHPHDTESLNFGAVAAAHDLTDHPEKLGGDTLRRARVLILIGVGMVDGEVVHQIRQRAAAGGTDGVWEWLDGISAGAETPGVVSLEAARRRREQTR